MKQSRNALAWTDQTYLNDCSDERGLEQLYEYLDLTKEQKKVMNDYVACTLTSNQRYANISYMCSIKDMISMIVFLGLFKGVEAEE